eukprot:8118479-Lingulodinium_polyedra.AAC.1
MRRKVLYYLLALSCHEVHQVERGGSPTDPNAGAAIANAEMQTDQDNYNSSTQADGAPEPRRTIS